MSNRISHQIATKAARQIVNEGMDAGLEWSTIAVSCETAIAIVVLAAADMSGTPDKLRFATEIMNTMTERAHQRIIALIEGKTYEG